MNLTDVGKEFLEHYGVKGQKWGVRRSKKELSKKSADRKEVDELLKRPRRSLSNTELKRVNERLNLEQNAARLNPTATQRGARRAKAIIGAIGVGVSMYNLVNSPAGKAAVTAGKKVVNKS